MTSLEKKVVSFFKYLLLWEVGGAVYYTIEILYRGYSHPSMFILGGICLILIGLINNVFSYNMYFELQILIGDIMVIILEFCTGMIVNVWLGWNVWDYSEVPGNLLGQICPQFAILWLPIVAVAILVDDWIRYQYLNEDDPTYRFWIEEKFFSNKRL